MTEKTTALDVILEIIELQKEKEALETQSKMLNNSFAINQTGGKPRYYEKLVDQQIKLGEKQATLWNSIRGFISSDRKRTLWVYAISENMPVVRYGKESMLKLESNHLVELLSVVRT